MCLCNKLTLKFKKLSLAAKLPVYASKNASGMDVSSAEDFILTKGCRALTSTGLSVEIPPGWEIQVRPRSGLAFKHGVTVLNSPGTIDSDYRGEIKVLLMNTGDSDFTVTKGLRIAQLVVCRVPVVSIEEVSTLSNTERGEGGFGSTGQ